METRLSIIVPLYNETRRIKAGIDGIREYLDQSKVPVEVVLVDDGSRDETAKIARDLIGNDSRFRLVAYTPNQGKGHAVKQGILAAKGEIRLFTDIDLSVPIETADLFIAAIDDGNDVVIGTRRTAQSNVEVHQPKIREMFGEGFRRFARSIFAPEVTDLTCGFKAFKAEAADRIFSHSLIKRWVFDVEIMFLASRWKFSIHEIPVTWINSPDTKVNLGLDIARSAVEMAVIRLNWFLGKYPKK